MRTIVMVCLVIAAACQSKSEDPKAIGSGLRITYDIDLDRAVDDKAIEIKRELEDSPGTTVNVAMSGVITVVPSDPSTTAALRSRIETDYREVVEPRPCAPDAAPGAVCIGIRAAYAASVKSAALARAAKTVARRLDELKVTGASAAPKGDQIVVEIHGASEAVLSTMRNLLGRSGVLELKVVDDGSPFMKRVFQKVGSDGMEGRATDPEAAAAGISAGIDQWRAEIDSVEHSDFYLRGPERESLRRYFARLAVADPTFALPEDRMLGFELVEPDTKSERPLWRSYLLERRTDLTGAALSNAETTSDPNVNRPIVLLDFNREGGRVFGELTGRIGGKKLAIVLDGTVKSAPIINGPIRGGRASITMAGADPAQQMQDANDLAIVLRSGALPAPMREASVDVIP